MNLTSCLVISDTVITLTTCLPRNVFHDAMDTSLLKFKHFDALQNANRRFNEASAMASGSLASEIFLQKAISIGVALEKIVKLVFLCDCIAIHLRNLIEIKQPLGRSRPSHSALSFSSISPDQAKFRRGSPLSVRSLVLCSDHLSSFSFTITIMVLTVLNISDNNFDTV